MKLIKFEASWCMPCKQLTKTLESMEIPYEVEVVDIDKSPELAVKYSVRGVPTLVLLEDTGQEVKRITGSVTQSKLKEELDI